MSWHAIVFDESGGFSRKSERCVVAGVLVAGMNDGELDRARWRRAFERASMPWLPWPPHATDLRHVGMYVLWLLARGRPVPKIARATQALCDPDERVRLDAVVRRMIEDRAGRSEVRGMADKVREVVGRDPPVAAALERLKDSTVAHIEALVQQTVSFSSAAGRPMGFVAAAEDHPGDASLEPLAGDRYLSLLAIAIGRAHAIASARQGVADSGELDQIDVYVCQRGAEVDGESVRSAIDAAGPPSSVTQMRRHLRARRPIAGNGQEAEVAAVIADWLANRTFWAVHGKRGRTRSLQEVLNFSIKRLGFSTIGPPALAASGPTFQALQLIDVEPLDVLRDRIASAACRWAREQAEGWLP